MTWKLWNKKFKRKTSIDTFLLFFWTLSQIAIHFFLSKKFCFYYVLNSKNFPKKWQFVFDEFIHIFNTLLEIKYNNSKHELNTSGTQIFFSDFHLNKFIDICDISERKQRKTTSRPTNIFAAISFVNLS